MSKNTNQAYTYSSYKEEGAPPVYRWNIQTSLPCNKDYYCDACFTIEDLAYCMNDSQYHINVQIQEIKLVYYECGH